MRSERTILRAIAACVAIALAGCGGSSDSKPANVDDFFDRFYAAVCKIRVACNDFPDPSTCMGSAPIDTTELLTLKAEVAAGKVRYDATQAGDCLRFVERFYGSGCTQSATGDASGNDVCNEVFTGAVADGDACFETFDCASGTCTQNELACSRAHQCCAGTCAPKATPIPAGAACSTAAPDVPCETGAVCLQSASATAQTCVMRSKVRGTACSVASECAPPLFCDLDSTGHAGTCQPAVPTGAACNATVAFGACDDLRDICDKTTGRCTRRPDVGAACDPTMLTNACLGDAQCVGTKCVARIPKGGACNGADGPGCLGSLACSAQDATCGFPATASACL